MTHIYVPCPEDEAIRDLVRARTDAVRAHTKARQQLSAFLLRLGIRYHSRTAWSPQHKRFIADISLPFPAQQVVFQEYVEAISEAAERVRGALVESAWAYHFPARVSRPLERRQQKVSKKIRQISWKAQQRLCARYRRLCRRGKIKQQVVTAIARELAAFIWAIAREVKIPA